MRIILEHIIYLTVVSQFEYVFSLTLAIKLHNFHNIAKNGRL
jgi:hypothetical protein